MRQLHHFHIMLAAIAVSFAAVGVFAQAAPRITSGPTVTEIAQDGAVVRWTTDVVSTTSVDFGVTTDLGQTYRKIVPIAETEVTETDHGMTLSELQPSTVYHYRVRSTASDGSVISSELGTFVTAAAPVPSLATEPVVESAPSIVAPVPDQVPAVVPMPPEQQEEPSAKPVPVSAIAPEKEEVRQEEARPAPLPAQTETVPSVGVTADAAESSIGRIIVRATTDDACVQAGIPAQRCAAWSAAKYADPTCERTGIFTREECLAAMTAAHDGIFPGCVAVTGSDAGCDAVIARTLTGYLPDAAKQEIDLIVRTGTVAQAFADLGDAAPLVIALREGKKADVRWWPSAAAAGTTTAPGVIVFDADKDGLPDDVETRVGTDPSKADSDGDGVSDKDQVLKALAAQAAEEKKAKKVDASKPPAFPRPSPIDLAFLNGKPLEQPFVVGETDASFHVAAGAEAPGTKNGVVLSGQAAPDAVVLLYVYSYVPMVLTTTTDSQGNFSYDLGDSVTDGKHTVYVALADDEGRIEKKSGPLSFFVSEANAATEEEFLRPDVDVKDTGVVADATRSYLWGAAALVLLGIIFTWSVSRRMKNGPA